MSQLLCESLAASLAILFIHTLFTEGMIFGRAGEWMEVFLPGWLYKPLIGCLVCMAPWWGIVYYGIFWCGSNLFAYLLCIGGFNVIISRITHEQSIDRPD